MIDLPPLTCRVLPYQVLDGPANMARDEALLDAVSAEPRAAVFRTYGWSEPTLSLGYFQHAAEVENDPRWRGVPWVRRPTGGGAIWHDREITYALVVPRAQPLARRASDLYRGVHAAIAEVLASQGVEAVARRGEVISEKNARRPFLCFADRDPEDIVIHQAKVVGSAQRRRPGAVLQHGSILLTSSARTPELPGLNDLTGVAAEIPPWSDLILRQIPRLLGFAPQHSDLTNAERHHAETLERETYRNPSWNRKR